jgi:hypothetical protein
MSNTRTAVVQSQKKVSIIAVKTFSSAPGRLPTYVLQDSRGHYLQYIPYKNGHTAVFGESAETALTLERPDAFASIISEFNFKKSHLSL